MECDSFVAVAHEDHTNEDCLVVVFMSHGESHGRLRAHDAIFQVHELWDHFVPSECPTLREKPKLFFIQVSLFELLIDNV